MLYTDTLMWRELNEAPSVLKNLSAENAEALAKIAAGKKPAYVYTAARGTSDHAMLYLKYLFGIRNGIAVASGTPSAFTMYGAGPSLKDALVVGCSQSGAAADAAAVLAAAKADGAATVAVTNRKGSLLAETADTHLYCACGEERSVAATKTFSAQLEIVRLLSGALAGEEVRCGADVLLAAGDSAAAAAAYLSAELKDSSECFVLGRGVTSAVAFECALKLQETCYIKARAYHSSDFYHGPMAMVSEGAKVILFASANGFGGNGEAQRKDAVLCAEKMKELGAELYVVTDMPDAFRDITPHVCPVAGGADEGETALAFAFAAQMTACRTSVLRGLNPDSPRALKKVTVTL